MKVFKQGHPEIISFCDCIAGNLDHGLTIFIFGRFLRRRICERDEEKRRSELFHGWVEAERK